MSTPTAPVVTAPHGGVDFTTNRDLVTFAGTVDLLGVSEVRVNGSSDNVTYVAGTGVWTVDVTISEGANTFSFVAISDDATPLESSTTEVVVTFSDTLGTVVTNPTGIEEDVLRDAVQVTWAENPEPQVIGYNVYGSLTAGGGDDGYVKLNDLLISSIYEVRTELSPISETIEQEGSTRTTTTVEEVVETRHYAFQTDTFDGEPLSLGETVHLVVTAVAFDTGASEEIESPYSEEIGITPLILTEARVASPTRTQQQIAEDYANKVREVQPNLDIKPGQVTNDVHINPPATEMEKLYFLLDFLSKAQSFVELLAIDDPNGDGISDDVEDVPYKRTLRAALSTDSNTVTQDYIDAAFTRLASISGTEREPASAASNAYVFFTPNRPTTDVSIPAGSVVASQGNSEQGVSAQQYSSTASVFVSEENLDAYYNPTTERFEFSSFVQAVSPGEAGNQDVGEINIVVSGPNVTLQGENTVIFSNGTDEETNSSLALRAQLAFTGVDSGTRDGYRKAAVGVPLVERASVVGAGCPDMQRDFNCFLKDHLGCKVDVYIQGETPLDNTDEPAFSYYQTESNTLTIVDAANFIFEVDTDTLQLSTSEDHPIFEVTEVRNVTQAVSYDVDLVRFDGDRFTMDTTNPINAGLVSTDLVQATFRWRDGDPLVLPTQPVDSVTTVTGDSSGTLVAGTNYNFDNSADPLLLGNSTRSDDSVVLNFGPGEAVEDEPHVLNGSTASQLLTPDIDTSTVVVTDTTGEITYTEGGDYELDTFQRVLLEDEEHQLSSVSTAYLTYDTVISATVEVRAGATPVLMTEGVDYTVEVSGLRLGLRRIVGGGISEGETVYVTYRIEIPVQFTTIARLVAVTPSSSIGDGDTVLVSYNAGVPRGRPVLVEDEEIVLVGTEFVELERKGVIEGTVEVLDPSAASPNTFTAGIDYVLELGGDDTATQIRRLEGGSIVDGATVEVTYRTNERFTIVYTNNDLIRVTQEVIDDTRHVAADVLVKGALDAEVDLEITVVPVRGVNRLNLISNIRTAISRHFTSLDLRAGVYQADIIAVIEAVTGVDHTVVPFLKMARAEGSIVLREEHRFPEWSLYSSVPVVPSPGNVAPSYRSQAGTLEFTTTAGGGSPYLPRGVYEDDSPLTVVDSIDEVKGAYGRAYIAADGSIVISPIDEQPDNHTYTVTYQVGLETGVNDIRLTSLETATLGTIAVSLSDAESAGVC